MLFNTSAAWLYQTVHDLLGAKAEDAVAESFRMQFRKMWDWTSAITGRKYYRLPIGSTDCPFSRDSHLRQDPNKLPSKAA